MNPRRKKRLLITCSLIFGLSLAMGLTLFALQQNIDLFYTPNEILEGKNETGVKPEIGQRLRVGGMVLTGSVKRDPDSLKVSFDLVDNKAGQVTVYFDGILPDLFREGQGIVAQGTLKSKNSVDAFEVLAKHDEDYMPPEVADAVKGMSNLKTEQ
ncbi:cytochrome c maturation protein CcmE [Psychromonas sp. 14N.309.X.WAT.B.A12]|uniref:cytochrome c maturation protein CcmE n=1 Tax=unclassified Psychromonas TaxID=2614957 RepID=UPI0025B1C896|nr:cytochrome c maturation protein CcmE [Psychromonas sp. 14N.309.X.WAT.B.A12]MDN2662866.1 cytochrome c maturation protein CcmE [Psychromonas sp. 14N.309.X.WAT.B.A12]